MKFNKLIIITIMLFALLLCIDIANASIYTDDFSTDTVNNYDVEQGSANNILTWRYATEDDVLFRTYSSYTMVWQKENYVPYRDDFYAQSHFTMGNNVNYYLNFEANNRTGEYKFLQVYVENGAGQHVLAVNDNGTFAKITLPTTFTLGREYLLKVNVKNVDGIGHVYVYIDGVCKIDGNHLSGIYNDYDYIKAGFEAYSLSDNYYTSVNDFEFSHNGIFTNTTNTTFNGYIKDANGNPLQYCNVTLWNGDIYGTYLNSGLTDANGYYSFGPSSLNIGGLYNMSVRPPNMQYTNAYAFTANTTTPLTLNFTSNPARLQIYAYDANYGIAYDLQGINITYNINNGQTTNTLTGYNSPYTEPNVIPAGVSVVVNVSKAGYIDGSATIESTTGGYNIVSVPMYQDFAGGSFVYMLGYIRTGGDGYRVPGVKAWLLDEVNNVIDTSTSGAGTAAGYYALKVPTTPDIIYHVIVYAPGYGNKTAHLHNGGSTMSFGTGSTFTYPDDYAGTIDGNAQVDLILDDLTWVPSTYPTPTPSTGAPVVPNGYNTIYGSTYVITTGQNIAGVPLWVYGQDGSTLIGSATTDASGNFVITFSTGGLASQILKVVPGETAKYNNDSATTYISWPFAAGSSSYRCDVGLSANANYAQWIMQGYFYNALKGDQYHISGGTLNLWTGDGNTLVSTVGTNGNGYYVMYLEQTITPGTYIVEAKATGYTHANMTMSIPESFGSDEYYNLSLAMVPASIGTDNNNALGIQITDNSTGNILNNAHFVVRYAANGTTYTTGSMGGQYVVYIYNLPPATYEIEGSFVGYDTTSYVIEIAANNWYKIIIGLTPVLAPTPYPTGTIGPGTPTPVTNPNGGLQWDGILAYMLNSFGIYDPVLVRLLKGVLIMFGLALGGGFAGAILERGKGTAVTLLFAVIGAGLGFIIACLVPGIWPWWLLVVVLIVAIFGFVLWKYISGGLNTGGNGGA